MANRVASRTTHTRGPSSMPPGPHQSPSRRLRPPGGTCHRQGGQRRSRRRRMRRWLGICCFDPLGNYPVWEVRSTAQTTYRRAWVRSFRGRRALLIQRLDGCENLLQSSTRMGLCGTEERSQSGRVWQECTEAIPSMGMRAGLPKGKCEKKRNRMASRDGRQARRGSDLQVGSHAKKAQRPDSCWDAPWKAPRAISCVMPFAHGPRLKQTPPAPTEVAAAVWARYL